MYEFSVRFTTYGERGDPVLSHGFGFGLFGAYHPDCLRLVLLSSLASHDYDSNLNLLFNFILSMFN